MKKEIVYEWCIEDRDEFGDVEDLNFADNLADLNTETGDIVLVRSEGNDAEGVTDRYWAYVKDGKLPDVFEIAGELTQIKIPNRFHKEVDLYFQTKNT
jgi:hypothetical protein